MPLSRLSPRSSRTGVARQRTRSRAQTENQRHLHLWAAIRKTREELDQWDRQARQVNTLFSQHIAPREHKLTQAVSALTSQLIKHFSQGELDIPDQSLLGLWITENLNSLQDHPFSDGSQTKQLSIQWLALINNDGPVENQLARLAMKHDFGGRAQQGDSETSADVDEQRPYGFESYDAHMDDTVKNSKQHKQNASADAEDIPTDTNTNKNPTEPPIADTIKTLEDKLSVERLFRQLAKVLHPDREQDEEAKAAKHELMSQCLKARQEKDIHALLTLYCEHVGDLPDDLNNNSHNELVNALEVQLNQLQLELREKRFGDPLHAMIIERYSSSTSADCEKRIKDHARSLDDEITAAENTAYQLNEHDGLLDALDERRALEQDRMAIDEMTGM